MPRLPLEKIELPRIAFPVPLPTFTPVCPLLAMMFAAPAEVPPTVVPFPSMKIPLVVFGSETDPLAFVPMRFP